MPNSTEAAEVEEHAAALLEHPSFAGMALVLVPAGLVDAFEQGRGNLRGVDVEFKWHAAGLGGDRQFASMTIDARDPADRPPARKPRARKAASK